MCNLASQNNFQKIKKCLSSTLIIMASASSNSINEKVMQNFLEIMQKKKFCADILNLRNYTKEIPMLLENYTIPEKIEEIYEIIKKYKSMIIFAPEHGGHISAFFKNIIEWLGLKNKSFLIGKKIIIISASTTAKTKRYMEEGINNTFRVYGGETKKFINYNNYLEANIEERGEWLFEEIISCFI